MLGYNCCNLKKGHTVSRFKKDCPEPAKKSGEPASIAAKRVTVIAVPSEPDFHGIMDAQLLVMRALIPSSARVVFALLVSLVSIR